MVSYGRITRYRPDLGSHLQDSQFVHLARASWYHVLQDGKLLVHLGPSSPLNEAVCRLPCDLPTSGTRRRWLLLLCWPGLTSSRYSCSLLSTGCAGRALAGRRRFRGLLLLLRPGLHLDDLTGSRRRWRQGEIAILIRGRGGGRSPPRLDSLTGLYPKWGLG